MGKKVIKKPSFETVQAVLENVARTTMAYKSGWSMGAALYNALLNLKVGEYYGTDFAFNKIERKKCDPMFDDNNIPAFWEAVRKEFA